MDQKLYRITFICKCGTDAGYGYGPTQEAAKQTALAFWKRGGHKRKDILSEIVEHAVTSANGSSHYEEVK
jgi:hypothetical protein